MSSLGPISAGVTSRYLVMSEISSRLMLRCRRMLFHHPPLLLHDGGGRGGGDVDHGSPYFSRGRKNPISVASRPSSPPPRPSIPIIPRTKKLEVQFLSSNSSELAERIPLRARAPSPNVHPKACDACVAGGGLGGGATAMRRCGGEGHDGDDDDDNDAAIAADGENN